MSLVSVMSSFETWERYAEVVYNLLASLALPGLEWIPEKVR